MELEAVWCNIIRPEVIGTRVCILLDIGDNAKAMRGILPNNIQMPAVKEYIGTMLLTSVLDMVEGY